MQMCSLLRTIFYGIKVVSLTTLAAMRIGFKNYKIDLVTHPKPCNGYSFSVVFSSIFGIFIKIHEYANEIIFI